MANPTQDLLIFVGIPLATIGIIFALVYAAPGGRGTKRYRPGRPYPYRPVWFLARPGKDGPAGRPARAGLEAPGRPARAELTASEGVVAAVAATDAAVAAREHPGVTGGASDRW